MTHRLPGRASSVSFSLLLSCFSVSPLRGLLQFFAVDPGVRWKTYTHKQHLLFMPYSPVIHSQHAPATAAVQPLQSPTNGQDRPRRRQHVCRHIQVSMRPLQPTVVITKTYSDKHICFASDFKIRQSCTLLTTRTFSQS